MEIFNLRGEHAVKILELEDKIDKLTKEIESSRKHVADLNKQILELKVNFILVIFSLFFVYYYFTRVL